MQKWTVLVIVVLLALVLGLQSLLNKHEAQAPVVPAHQGEPSSAAAPAPAAVTGMIASPMQEIGASHVTGAVSSEFMGFQSACSGGVTLDDVVNARQGLTTLGALYDPHDTDEIFTAMNNFFTCKAIVEGGTAPCEFMPSVIPAEKGGGPGKETPRDRCVKPVNNETLFVAYLAGRYPTGNPLCLSKAATMEIPKPGQFCAWSVNRMDKICDGAPAGEKKEGCLKEFPAKKSDCTGDGAAPCLVRYGLYTALKAGNAAQCPDTYRSVCEAILTTSRGATCAELGEKAGKLYCAYVGKLKKKQDDKLAQEQKVAARKQADEEYKKKMALQKEQQKEQDAINKRAREILRRK